MQSTAYRKRKENIGMMKIDIKIRPKKKNKKQKRMVKNTDITCVKKTNKKMKGYMKEYNKINPAMSLKKKRKQ